MLLNKRLDLAANARLEEVNTNSFLLPGASASYSLTKWLLLRANAQKTYRTPTLNELYYSPGGNPTLKPEHGWSEDAGYTMHIGNGNFMLSHSLSGFNRDIKDWIIWMGGAIWTPHNIAEVHSRGLETENRLEYHVSSHAVLHFGINTSYVLATTVSSAIANDGSVGKQIPYMPRYNGQINCGIAINRFYVNYNHTYTGYRFTVADESQYLQPYNTGNVQLMYPTKLGKYPLMLNGQLNNIWNEQYTIVSSRPMPGINWLAGVRFTLN